MPPVFPSSTLFPYTTLFRSPSPRPGAAPPGTRRPARRGPAGRRPPPRTARRRSEEHTSELHSRQSLVCRLLHENKNVLPIGLPLPAQVWAVEPTLKTYHISA